MRVQVAGQGPAAIGRELGHEPHHPVATVVGLERGQRVGHRVADVADGHPLAEQGIDQAAAGQLDRDLAGAAREAAKCASHSSTWVSASLRTRMSPTSGASPATGSASASSSHSRKPPAKLGVDRRPGETGGTETIEERRHRRRRRRRRCIRRRRARSHAHQHDRRV